MGFRKRNQLSGPMLGFFTLLTPLFFNLSKEAINQGEAFTFNDMSSVRLANLVNYCVNHRHQHCLVGHVELHVIIDLLSSKSYPTDIIAWKTNSA